LAGDEAAIRASQPLHRWDLSVAEALALQERLRPLVGRGEALALDQIRMVAGLDAAYWEDGGIGRGRAAAVVLSFPDLEVVERATADTEVAFPYVPGLLSFREAPALLAALERLTTRPDVLLCDGQGYAHPRRFGLACHLGLYLGRPSIGCAKTRLIGTHDEPGPDRGDSAALMDGVEEIGAVVRTRARTRPVYVSVGYRIDLPTAVAVVLRCARGYRLPEPIRLADQLAGRA
jgi:deoxyribonuclease V